MTLKILICLDTVRNLQLHINWLPVSYYLIAGRVCHGKTAFRLLLFSVSAKASPVGCYWGGYSGPLDCQNFVLIFFEAHHYLGDHRTKSTVKNYMVASYYEQQLNEYIQFIWSRLSSRYIKITLLFLLLPVPCF